ncbi:hypothetical protein BOSEA31B_11504 [Hyphomicrobiales bacterium]|nr:hypothetical protein BOSEA31B_11504 [Hyphomicrobiales bacterium]CAH1697300.1 hypothetical protein BOSEA1005_10337 [Hyphomicrobiales bacterium]CAI0345486.1 hypothetical protein BO1005MUT1_30001 [Hyphomicrobiales bacterium]
MSDLTKRELLTFLGGSAAALAAGPVWAQGQKRGGTVVIPLIGGTPSSLNPAINVGYLTAMPGTQLFASPLRFDANWKPQPYLARSWEVSADGLSLTLKLVPGATFHDGKPITSADVAFSVMALKKNHPFQQIFAPVTGVDTPDAGTAILRLSRPQAALLLAMSPALCPILPKHVFDDGRDLRTHPANIAPVGSGPFRFVEFTPGQQIC